MPSPSDFNDLLRYQNLLAQQVARQASTDKKITFLQLVAKLGGATRKKVQTAVLIHEAETRGFTEGEAYAVLEELEREGMIVPAGEGYVKRG
jgi:DNA replicative helicase MCM subunit Mcm2 (Cdc46/Mcm family)